MCGYTCAIDRSGHAIVNAGEESQRREAQWRRWKASYCMCCRTSSTVLSGVKWVGRTRATQGELPLARFSDVDWLERLDCRRYDVR